MVLLDFVNRPPEQHILGMFEGYTELRPLTVGQIDQVLKQSLYLAKAYKNVLRHMGTKPGLGVNAVMLPLMNCQRLVSQR
jgi:hypothetical protein